MDARFNILSQQIFNKSLNECSEHEIRSFIKQHPYFSPTQFLLLKKLDKNSEAYHAQFQKAILYYHDPHAFNFLVNAEDYASDIEEIEPRNIEQGAGNREQGTRNSEQGTSPPVPVGTGNREQGTGNFEKARPDYPVEQGTGNTEQGTRQEIEESFSFNRVDKEQQISPPVQAGNEKKDFQDINIQEEKQELQKSNEQTPAQTEELSFEPFHTVDYFASVGIKLSQEEVTKDRMGMQLKSFTEWLKTMKRLPVPELEKKLGGPNDQKVENMAADSVQNSDVVTEAMAEVWVKQGNVSKAIEVYNKLGLQNPAKSAYFAAKIDHLKEQT